MRKHLSFFSTECFLFHSFLCFEKEKKESVLNVMYRDSGSETAAVLLFSCKHPHAQWPFIPRSLTWQELRLPCHRQLLQAQRDQDLQPQVMDSIHNHRVPWAPWSLGPGNATFGMHLPSPAHHLHYTARKKSKHLTFFFFLYSVRRSNLNFIQFILSLVSYSVARALWNHWQKIGCLLPALAHKSRLKWCRLFF